MGGMFSTSFDPSRDLPDLQGMVIIVTGGNSGIGFTTVQHLVRQGAKVYLAARNKNKAEEAIARLEAEGKGSGQVQWLDLDLSDPRKAKASAEQFLLKEDRLDVLVNNAAILACPYAKSVDGISDIMMVNYLSPFVFTQALVPLLVKTARESGSDVRIVNLASDAHNYVPKDIRFRNIDDLNQDYETYWNTTTVRYGATKLAAILWTRELQRRFESENVPILTLTLHPGVVNSEGNRVLLSNYHMSWFADTFLTSPAVGAWTSVFAAASPAVRAEPDKYKGAYLVPVGKLSQSSKIAEDRELSRELWETTERILSHIGM